MEGRREGSADSSEDENLPPPHGLFSSPFFFFLLAPCSFGFHPLLPVTALGTAGFVCVCACVQIVFAHMDIGAHMLNSRRDCHRWGVRGEKEVT